MENISFVLWVCLWPLTVSIGNFFDAKRRKVSGEEELSTDSKLINAVVFLIIWVAVARSI